MESELPSEAALFLSCEAIKAESGNPLFKKNLFYVGV